METEAPMEQAERHPTMSRRRFFRVAGGAVALGATSYVVARGLTFDGGGDDTKTAVRGASGPHRLEDFASNIRSGGPPKDGIPPIDDPRFVTASEANFLSDDDVVFGLVLGDEARAYPQLVVVWHEIVNDRFDDGPISVTYCPLTGSVVGFRGVAPDGQPYTFGTSGDLVNSNLLMYDRQTDSRWPQILATGIQGRQEGQELEEIPIEWTTWRRWKKAFPRTRVLSTETGHLRSYGTDPYGDYTPLGGYYRSGRPFFPTMATSDRFPPKEVFIGAKHGPLRIAVRKESLRRDKALAVSAGGDTLAALYDPDLDEGRVFLVPSGMSAPRPAGNRIGEYVDPRTGTQWDARGRPAAASRGAALQRVPSYDVMWFAWFAFFPDTEVLG